MTSQDNTVISLPGQSIVDAQGNTWSIINSQVAVNGVPDPTTGRVIEMAYEKGLIWQKNTDNLWWSKTTPSDAWSPTYGTSVNPMPGIIPSVDDTVVRTAAHVITDASGNTWSILNEQVALNGVADQTTGNVIELAYKDGKIWQENTANLWWGKTIPSDRWGPLYGTATSPVVVTTIKTWVTNGPFASGNFLDGQNWSGGVAPGAGDTAIIRNGVAVVAAPTGPGALGEGGLTLYLGATDPTKSAELETTVNTTIASQMTIITGSATGGVAPGYIGTIFSINSSLTNEGHINVVSGAAPAELDIHLRNATLVNFNVINETGAKGVLRIEDTTQYGHSGMATNNGLMTVNGGLLDIETRMGGHGHLQVNDGGILKIGNSFAAGNNIAINTGILEFGPVVVSPSPGWATNPGMQFLGSLAFGSASSGAYHSTTEEIKIDGVWQAGSALSVALTNIQPGMAEISVFEGTRKIFDASLLGNYDATEFSVGHSGKDVTIMFHDHTLTTVIPLS